MKEALKESLPICVFVAAVSFSILAIWAVHSWADRVDDAQLVTQVQLAKTQQQLEQLVLIVTRADADQEAYSRAQRMHIKRIEQRLSVIRAELDVHGAQ